MIIQEEFGDDAWKLLVGCILLNQTSNVQVRRVIYSLFERWPNPEAMSKADPSEVAEHIRTLGFYNRRAKSLIRFSTEYIAKDFETASELHAIGKYGDDSYQMFIKGNMDVRPTDRILLAWLKGEPIPQ